MVELLVTPKSITHMETLIEKGADAFVIGEQKFGLRLPGEFNREMMKEAVEIAHRNNKKVYAAVNGLSLIHISEPTRRTERSRMPSSA